MESSARPRWKLAYPPPQVTVHGASGLRGKDGWGPWAKSDPFVVVSVGDSSGETRVEKGTLLPSWEQTFHLFVT